MLYQMKIQQISPWSFYNDYPNNQQIFELDKFSNRNKSQLLPKLKKKTLKSSHDIFINKPNSLKKKSSSSVSMFASINEEEMTNEDINSLLPLNFESMSSKGCHQLIQLQKQSKELLKENQNRMILVFINQQLKKQKNDFAFKKLHQLPIENQQPIPQKQTLKLPKLHKSKQCLLFKYKLGQQLKHNSKQFNQQMLNYILKKKIDSEIRHKMRALGKSKLLIPRESISHQSSSLHL